MVALRLDQVGVLVVEGVVALLVIRVTLEPMGIAGQLEMSEPTVMVED